MKKCLLGTVMLLLACSSFAQKLSVSPEDITIAAGEQVEIKIACEHTRAKFFSGLQGILFLPVGVSPVVTNYDDAVASYEEDLEYAEEDGLDPATLYLEKYFKFDIKANVNEGLGSDEFFTLSTNYVPASRTKSPEKGMNEFRFLLYNPANAAFFPVEKNVPQTIFTLKVKAEDTMQTGKYEVELGGNDDQALSMTNKNNLRVVPDEVPYSIDYVVNYTIGESGYGTFCWPVALDFTDNSDLEAGVVAAHNGAFLKKVDDTKFAAKTPIIIKGEPGTYSLKTTKEEIAAPAANLLKGTVSGPLRVTANNIYALAEKSTGVGFYRVDETKEVVIPQYKAYLEGEEAAVAGYFFDDATGISQMASDAEQGDIYTISGMKVEKAANKGIYIINGKKVVVK